MRDLVGEVLESRYRLIAKVGAGAFGVVYRARDLETRDEVAIKLLKGEAAQDPSLAIRFEREALAMARLRGTSAVYVHRMGHTKKGLPFIVMEMLYGTELEDFLIAAEEKGGRLKREHALSVLRPIAATLDVAHQHGIVHRDVKPSNIFMVDPVHGGGVRLMDFGLSKLLDASALTALGMVAGTPSYIAPEAWKGDPSKIDHRIDVYSLGVVVYRCLSGQVPLPRKSVPEVCVWAQTGERPSLVALRPNLPAQLDDWVQKALAIDPEARFQSIRDLWNGLEAVLAGTGKAPW